METPKFLYEPTIPDKISHHIARIGQDHLRGASLCGRGAECRAAQTRSGWMIGGREICWVSLWDFMVNHINNGITHLICILIDYNLMDVSHYYGDFMEFVMVKHINHVVERMTKPSCRSPEIGSINHSQSWVVYDIVLTTLIIEYGGFHNWEISKMDGLGWKIRI